MFFWQQSIEQPPELPSQVLLLQQDIDRKNDADDRVGDPAYDRGRDAERTAQNITLLKEIPDHCADLPPVYIEKALPQRIDLCFKHGQHLGRIIEQLRDARNRTRHFPANGGKGIIQLRHHHKEHNDNYADHYNQRQQKAPDALHLTHSFILRCLFSCKEVALKKTHGHIQHKCNTPTNQERSSQTHYIAQRCRNQPCILQADVKEDRKGDQPHDLFHRIAVQIQYLRPHLHFNCILI